MGAVGLLDLSTRPSSVTCGDSSTPLLRGKPKDNADKLFLKIINVASRVSLRSATQFADTSASVGEGARFLIIEGYNLSCAEGNALKIVKFVFVPQKTNLRERYFM